MSSGQMGDRPHCESVPVAATSGGTQRRGRTQKMTASVQQRFSSRNGAGLADIAQTPIRCLVVDDHPAILAGLRGLLASEPGFDVVDALDSAEAAIGRAEEVALDVAIVDYQLPG